MLLLLIPSGSLGAPLAPFRPRRVSFWSASRVRLPPWPRSDASCRGAPAPALCPSLTAPLVVSPPDFDIPLPPSLRCRLVIISTAGSGRGRYGLVPFIGAVPMAHSTAPPAIGFAPTGPAPPDFDISPHPPVPVTPACRASPAPRSLVLSFPHASPRPSLPSPAPLPPAHSSVPPCPPAPAPPTTGASPLFLPSLSSPLSPSLLPPSSPSPLPSFPRFCFSHSTV